MGRLKEVGIRSIQIGVNLPVDLIMAIDRWALATDYLRGDKPNRSGAVKALLLMALADGDILDAAIRARRLALVGGISDRLRQLYMQVHRIMMDEINEVDDAS